MRACPILYNFPLFLPHCFIKEFLAQPLFILKIKEYKFPFIFKKVGWEFISIIGTSFLRPKPKRMFRRNNIQPSCIEFILCNLQIGAVQKFESITALAWAMTTGSTLRSFKPRHENARVERIIIFINRMQLLLLIVFIIFSKCISH